MPIYRTSIVILALLMVVHHARASHPIRFEIKTLTVDANEGCDIADIDGDGQLDVVAGRNWYRQGDWVSRPLRQIDDISGYVQSNGDTVYDVNGDGRPDVISIGFFQPVVSWYENPGPERLGQGMLWAAHRLADTGQTTNEFSLFTDLDGDGTPEWITNQWTDATPLIVWRFRVQPGQQTTPPELIPHLIGPSNGHGIGVGDINNDGRRDILVGTGWYEQPATEPYAKEWQFHPDWTPPLSCPVLVRDLDEDGLHDIVWGSPHDFGLFAWFGQGADADGKLQFEQVEIDDTFSQAHCIHFADLDGDGRDELITGKRVRAHNGNDPGGKEPPLVVYYVIDPQQRRFERHVIDQGRVGIGLQIRSADIDQDGDVDLVLPGKDGTQILFNQRQ